MFFKPTKKKEEETIPTVIKFLTKEQLITYKKGACVTCPFCFAHGKMVPITDVFDKNHQNIKCRNCGEKWTDVIEFVKK